RMVHGGNNASPADKRRVPDETRDDRPWRRVELASSGQSRRHLGGKDADRGSTTVEVQEGPRNCHHLQRDAHCAGCCGSETNRHNYSYSKMNISRAKTALVAQTTAEEGHGQF